MYLRMRKCSKKKESLKKAKKDMRSSRQDSEQKPMRKYSQDLYM